MKYISAIFLSILILGISKSTISQEENAAIIEGYILLNQLKQESTDELNQLEFHYPILRAEKEKILQDCNDRTAEYTLQLNHLIDIDNSFGERIQKAQEKINSHVERISQNLADIAGLTKDRCDQNELFIKALKENKQTLRLIGTLKYLILAYEEGSTESNNQKIQDLINTNGAFNLKDYLSLLQSNQIPREVRERSEEEIGVGYQYHDKNQISLDDFSEKVIEQLSQVKDELFVILDQLQAKTLERIQELINTEINLGASAAETIFIKEQENRYLQTEIEGLDVLISKLTPKKVNSDANVNAQKEKIAENVQKCEENSKDLQNYIDFYNRKKAQFLDELATFDEIIVMYQQFAMTPEDAKRVDQYIAEGGLDASSISQENLEGMMNDLDSQYPGA